MREKLMIMAVSVGIGFIGAFSIAGAAAPGGISQSQENSEETSLQEGIAEQILRFHVLADSDSEEDQELKLKVKAEVIAYLETVLVDAEDLEATREVILKEMDQITATAERVVIAEGYDYQVKAALKEVWFPAKTYGAYTFPAGTYEALQIEIGAAAGKNWWCVLYPNLCFIDATHAVVLEPEEQMLQNILTEEEYEEICDIEPEDVEIRFRLAEIWQEWRQRE